jgi:hypothetical protein
LGSRYKWLLYTQKANKKKYGVEDGEYMVQQKAGKLEKSMAWGMRDIWIGLECCGWLAGKYKDMQQCRGSIKTWNDAGKYKDMQQCREV